MGKKPSAKKKGKALDTRGYATFSVASVVKKEEEDEPDQGVEEQAADGAAQAAEPAAGDGGDAPRSDAAAEQKPDDEAEEWEAFDPEAKERAAQEADAAAAEESAAGQLAEPEITEEYEEAVNRRLEEEISRFDKKYVPANATSSLDRRGGSAPAGVVLLSKAAEQRLDAALSYLREEDGISLMAFPRHWRYKGKLTYDRLSGIYLALEALGFTAEQVRWAMEKTLGYDVRAPMELLLVGKPREELPRQFGGDGPSNETPGAKEVKDAADGAPPAEGAAAGATAEAAASPGRGESEKPEEKEEAGNDEAEAAEAEAEAAEAEEEEEGSADEKAAAEEEPDETSPPAEEADEEELPKPKLQAAPKAMATAVEKEKAADFNKRWMAQYCAGDDSEDEPLLNPEEILERERKKDPTARYVKIQARRDELQRLCKALKDKKKKGTFKQNVSADMNKQREATAEVSRISAEMEALESGRWGPLDKSRMPERAPRQKGTGKGQGKDGGKAERRAAAIVKEKEATAAAEAAVDEMEEVPSLFDNPEGDAEAESAAPSKPQLPCRTYKIDGWTGRIPRQSLDEFVKKRLWPKGPLPNPLLTLGRVSQGNGRWRLRVQVHLPRGEVRDFEPEENCETLREAEHLACSWAFWKVSDAQDHSRLGKGLPLCFRQRWQEWDQQAMLRAKEDVARQRIEFLEKMLRTKVPPPLPTKAAGASADPENPLLARGIFTDGDDGTFVELGASQAAALRENFVRRREAAVKGGPYAELQNVRANLPVGEHKDYVLRMIRSSQVTVVSGATGSGKTTQVPQFVLEDALENSDSGEALPSIIVTEPRRISAVSVAKRVSQEMGDPSGGPGSRGSLVGYQIRMEKKVSDTTRLLFCTVGVLLKQLQAGMKALSKVTHVFIDEVHERSADCDLLILLLRQIRTSRPDIRICLMSATMEVEKLVRYFGTHVPVISIPGRTFPVDAFWMEDIIEMTGYVCDEDSDFAKRSWARGWSQKQTFQVSGQKGQQQKITTYMDDDDDWQCDDEAESADPSKYHEETLRSLARMDHTRINFDLIEATLEYIEQHHRFKDVRRDEGAVLVFLPGLGEITKMYERLSRSPTFGDPSLFLVLSLHSVLSGEEHAKAFDRPRRGQRKIVLSTNIAETGVTIPDCVFVIDAGKAKSQRYHEPSNTSSLKEQFVSRAEVMQRRGRAGRVRDGFCFTLITLNRFRLRLLDMPVPELLRSSLSELMLSVLSSGLQPSCFSGCLDPPPKSRIDQAVATLKATGAVEEGVRPSSAVRWGVQDDETWYVATPLGLCLARLPCDLRLGKMTLLAGLFGGNEAVWTVAATLSYRSPMATPFSDSKRAQAKAAHIETFLSKEQTPSDHFALNSAYVKWEEAKRSRKADSFCKQSWLTSSVLQAIKEIRNDLLDALKTDGFLEKFQKGEMPAGEVQSPATTAALIFAGLYPNVARVDAPKVPNDKQPLISAGGETLKLHPGSLCHGRVEGLHRTNNRWICYHTKLKTSASFLRDCTFLAPNALLLFSGDPAGMNIHPMEKAVTLGIGSEKHWHTIYVAPRVAAAIRQLRYAFDATLRRKATDPRQPLGAQDRQIISTYVSVLNSLDTE